MKPCTKAFHFYECLVSFCFDSLVLVELVFVQSLQSLIRQHFIQLYSLSLYHNYSYFLKIVLTNNQFPLFLKNLELQCPNDIV